MDDMWGFHNDMFHSNSIFWANEKNATLNICQHLDITLKFAEPQKCIWPIFGSLFHGNADNWKSSKKSQVPSLWESFCLHL